MSDEFKVGIVYFVFTCAVCLALGSLAELYSSRACDKYGEVTERKVKYVFWTGCFAKDSSGKFRYWKEFIDDRSL